LTFRLWEQLIRKISGNFNVQVRVEFLTLDGDGIGTGSAGLLTQATTVREIRFAINIDLAQGRPICLALDREKEIKDS
jgi:hypothetical protein